jgi:hypothetical protein
VRAIWCLILHLDLKYAVETGVAHGITSRFVLEALARNGSGQLWSIALPPMESPWKSQVSRQYLAFWDSTLASVLQRPYCGHRNW